MIDVIAHRITSMLTMDERLIVQDGHPSRQIERVEYRNRIQQWASRVPGALRLRIPVHESARHGRARRLAACVCRDFVSIARLAGFRCVAIHRSECAMATGCSPVSAPSPGSLQPNITNGPVAKSATGLWIRRWPPTTHEAWTAVDTPTANEQLGFSWNGGPVCSPSV